MAITFLRRLVGIDPPQRASFAKSIAARSRDRIDELNRGFAESQQMQYPKTLQQQVFGVVQSMSMEAGAVIAAQHTKLSHEQRWFADTVFGFRVFLTASIELEREALQVDANEFTYDCAQSWIHVFGYTKENAQKVALSARDAALEMILEFGKADHEYHESYKTWAGALDIFVVEHIRTKDPKFSAALETLYSTFFNGHFLHYFVWREQSGRTLLGFNRHGANAV